MRKRQDANMKTVLVSVALIASFASASAQTMPYGASPMPYGGTQNTVVSPRTWDHPPNIAPPSDESYVVVTPGRMPTYIQRLSPNSYRADPCAYRLGGCSDD